jgi:Cu+-exporting ATPase
MKKLRFGVKGMSCAACVAHVEHAAAKICGKDNVTVSLLTNSLTVICDDTVSDNKLYRDLQKSLSSAGYSLVDSAEKKRDGDRAEFKKALIKLCAKFPRA